MPSLRATCLGLLAALATFGAACGQGQPTVPNTGTPVAVPTSTPAASAATELTATARPATATARPTNTPAPRKQATAPAVSARVENATPAMGEQDNRPLQPTAQFRYGATEFYVVGELRDATESTSVRTSWRVVDAPEYRGSNPITTESKRISGSQWFWFRLHRDDSLPPGRYAAEIAVDQAAPHRVEFTVVAAAPPVAARPEKDLPSTPGRAQPTALQPTNLQFIVDASGSMNEPVEGVSKMEAARESLHSLVSALPTDPGVNVGLRAYGHRSAGANKTQSCQDTELLVPMQPVDRERLRTQIDALAAVGEYTPMAVAVQRAAADFQAGNAQNAIVLVSDGKENCVDEPENAIRAVATPIQLKVHVVGFDVRDDAEARGQLQRIAESTGGVYVDAQTPDELAEALEKLAAEQVQIARADNAPGQLKVEQVPGTTLYRLRIRDRNGKTVADDHTPRKDTYQLPAGTYVAQLNALSSGAGALFRIEVGSNQESPLRLGGVELITRDQPYAVAIVDQAMNRRVDEQFSWPKQPFALPPGHYTIWVRQTSGADWAVAQRDIEVRPNTILQVEI
jgi:Mg-chelatase subunit ChlD